MSTYSFTQDWPGPFARGPRKHRHHHRHDRHRAVAELSEMRGGPGSEDAPYGGRGGRGGPGGPFGRHGFGPGPRGRRGRARRGDVRLALLRLLGEEPSNGYQLMQTIEERSGGEWRPSPGTVYPRLAELQDEGLVRSTESEGSREYTITDAGREHLETRAEEPDPWDLPEDRDHPGRDTKRLIGAVAQAAMQVAIAGSEEQQARAVELLTETRRGLYRILAEDQES